MSTSRGFNSGTQLAAIVYTCIPRYVGDWPGIWMRNADPELWKPIYMPHFQLEDDTSMFKKAKINFEHLSYCCLSLYIWT